MTKEAAERIIQQKLTEMTEILNEHILPLARQYKVEFEFLGMQYHLWPMGHDADDPGTVEIYSKSTGKYRYMPRGPASEGLLAADEEWCSSSFGCSSRYWKWHEANWPEQSED